VLFQAIAKLAIEADADGDVLVVQEADEFVERFGRLPELLAFMGVNVDGWELGPRRTVLGKGEHRARLELIERQRPAVFAIERFLG
jgi:hypothetical protein